METELLKHFDALTVRKGYTTRSEAIRDLVRDALVDEGIREDRGMVYGSLTIVYDHHKRELEHKLTHLQHHHQDSIIATTHVHIDHDNCLEVILLKGSASVLKSISQKVISMKGVKHGKLAITSALKGL